MDVPLYRRYAYTVALAGAKHAVAAPDICGGVCRQPIGDTPAWDAAGPYPLAMISPEADLEAGLAALETMGCVCIVMIPDPLTGPPAARMERAFTVLRPFKPHLLIEVAAQGYDPSPHHRERIRRGFRRCRVEQIPLVERLQDWRRLYAHLVDKRGITGVANFSQDYFAFLAEQPEFTCFCAFVDDVVVGMTLWWAWSGVVYNHLSAFDSTGYANSASFALYDAAITHYGGEAVINLGGGAGLGDGKGGLFDFKLGFSNAQVMSQIAGSILDDAVYRRLAANLPGESFFPAYRAPRAR